MCAMFLRHIQSPHLPPNKKIKNSAHTFSFIRSFIQKRKKEKKKAHPNKRPWLQPLGFKLLDLNVIKYSNIMKFI